jgi:methyl coenzyme M reductase subunit C
MRWGRYWIILSLRFTASAPVGIVGAVASGNQLTLTDTERVVTVAMPVDQQQLARHGAAVRVELPDGSTTGGKITDTGRWSCRSAHCSASSARPR